MFSKIYWFALSLFLCLPCLSQHVDEEEMQSRMMDKTKKAIMSYEIVEEKTDAILESLQQSAFGKYAEKMAVVIPFATGKIQFSFKGLDVSYSHFSEKAKIDYRFGRRWRLFLKRKSEDEGLDEQTGVKYSFRF